MPRTTDPQPPLELEMWSVVDRAVDEVPRSIPAIDAAAMGLCMTLRTASNVVSYDLRQHLDSQSSLNAQKLNVMLVARLHGELEFHRITTFANMKKATASKLVDSMVVEGLLARRTSPTDRRVTLLSLTEAGRRRFEECFIVYNAREQFWAEGLTSEEIDTLGRLLKKLVDSRIGLSSLGEG